MPPYAGIYIEFFGPNRPEPQWLPQVSLSSATKLHHTASRTLLTQTFINPSTVSSIPSAKYTFPLYESCAVVAFRCCVGRRLIEGVIKEKEDASATYQAAVGRNEPASLLEQHTTDVFTTSIGNIPAGETVKVEIEYIMELKHDAEVDGLRFTIPTSIAPRYGSLPSGLSAGDLSSAATARNMNISVQVTMSSSIKSVQSPSHPISLYLGGHTTDTPDGAFNPQHALATLGQTSTELGKDFILLIKCASLSSPTALLEVDPTIPTSKALLVTLVPKFNLPKSAKPEVVFIVDRSGSMSSRVAPLRSSLSVFLKSLPLDVNFNICSFGSRHSFLWDRSRPYSNQSFAEAQRHCDGMNADFGGTEILPAIKSTIERRLKDLNLEIMVLTDGQVWNEDVLFKYVEKETEKGDVRLFSLGIGRDVSHALIDGLARVGRGFSQVVSDEREGMESKVARMLRGALSAHIINYRLEWEGKPSAVAAAVAVAAPAPTSSEPRRRISLFDSGANADLPVSFSDSQGFTVPSVIQAPYKIQPLFPFSRSTAYALLSSDAAPPARVWLRGTTPEGDELELEIAVQSLPVPGETIHQLAARKVLQELKDGTSYVHGALDKERQPGLLAEWVKKEGVRVGLKYGVASQWTSFVAVERKEADVVEEERRDQGVDEPPPGDGDEDEWDNIMQAERDSDGDDDDVTSNRPYGQPPAGQGGGHSVPVMMMTLPPPPPIPYPTKSKSKMSRQGRGGSAKSGKSDYSESLSSNWSTASSDSTFKADLTGSTQPTYGSSNLFGSNPTGKGLERESDKKSMLSFLSGRSSSKQPPSPTSSLSSPRSSLAGGAFSGPVLSPSESPAAAPGSAFGAFGSSPQPSPQSGFPYSTSPSTASAFSSAAPLFGSSVMFGASSSPQQMSQQLAPQPMFGYSAGQSSRPAPPSSPLAGTGPFVMPFDSVRDKSALNMSPSPNLFSTKQDYPGPLPKKDYKPSLGSSLFQKKQTFSTPDIGISYTPSSAPPPERLSADTGAQPLSSRTKSLIDLQTFEGCFVLDSALAALLGVPISVLEARLTWYGPNHAGLSPDRRRKVWATVLAIKLFETQLAGERSVWQLVVDKARAWMGALAEVGVEDITRLEKMAGEVLGV